ncbi:hypothetical protein [Streptomyces radicis]|uniref:Lipoprotein n=1 Tax=Streptomyces radicis TaxID=1750517 RepID=A0A3A9WDP3_9ACTN|nr:hypothetical protein [Streptomyces radicis]RKN10899.1 hypothetical protein D7319_07060 [Streptomyces radicis]RKN25162.1 hypothetical protein D7318_07915 [Streptomyces radicis]
MTPPTSHRITAVALAGAAAVAVAGAGCDVPPLPSDAADGSDIGACYDGACEVAVTGPTDIPVDPHITPNTFRITDTSGDTVTLVEHREIDVVTYEIPAGDGIGDRRLTFEVLAVEDGTALIRLSPGPAAAH